MAKDRLTSRQKIGIAIGILGVACMPASWVLHHVGAPPGITIAVFAATGPVILAGRLIADPP